MRDLLITGGLVVTAEATRKADVLVRDGLIAAVVTGIAPPEGAEVVDAGGCLVIPGGVDVHTHLDLTVGQAHVSDGWAAGGRAAAFGGTTTVVEHPGFGPAGCSLFHQLNAYRENAAEAVIDYGLHGVFQHWNQRVADELPQAVGAGFPSFKTYMTYDDRLNDEDLLAALKALAKAGGLMTVHAENHAIVSHLSGELRRTAPHSAMSHPASRPDYAEALAVETAIALARAVGDAPLYIVHLSTARGLAAVRAARRAGQPVWAETCPQYLLLTDEAYTGDFTEALQYVMAPPLRKPEDVEALWEGLADGTVSVVATDHCSFAWHTKQALAGGDVFRCPGGVPGVETRLALLYAEGVARRGLSLQRWVELTATAPARLFGLSGKGKLRPGAEADLVIFDPTAESVITAEGLHQAVDYTPFEGVRARGGVRTVFQRGRKIVDGEHFLAEPGQGKFMARRPFSA